MSIRIQTWAPFEIQIALNGREWLRRILDKEGIEYVLHSNKFLHIADYVTAQKLMDTQLATRWEGLLTSFLPDIFPRMCTLFGKETPYTYTWTLWQSEWATCGNYNVTARGDGFITNQTFVVSLGVRNLPPQNIIMSPETIAGASQFRIVLSWGQLPRDPDSHLRGPRPGGGTFHIFYGSRNFSHAGSLHANLDVDVTTGFGPETITISNFTDGRYEYYVHDFTNRLSTASHALRNLDFSLGQSCSKREPLLLQLPHL
jgi:hypothetical protein